MKASGDRVERCIGGALALLIAAIAGITFLDIVVRTFFGATSLSPSELMPDLFVWATFLGAALAARRGLHLGIPALRDRLGERARRRLERASVLGAVLFFAAVLWGGVEVLALSIRFGERMPMGYPAALVEVAVPIGALAIVWGTILAHREAVRGTSFSGGG